MEEGSFCPERGQPIGIKRDWRVSHHSRGDRSGLFRSVSDESEDERVKKYAKDGAALGK